MTVRIMCAASAIVLMVFALLFSGAAAALGAGTADQSSVPGPSIVAGRVTGGAVPPPTLGQIVRTSTDLLPGVPPGGYVSWFPAGECTSWGARNHPVSWSGDAHQWLAAARSAGVTVSAAPSIGAIVVYAAAWPYDAQFGHVAIVTDVGSATYTVSEMNYLGRGIVDARTVAWPDAHAEGFIP